MNKSAAIAILADDNIIEAVKQVIYSSYKYGNWHDDYILLAHDVAPEKLEWFKKRGIYIFATPGLITSEARENSPNRSRFWPEVVYSKLYLLHPDLARWEKVIYLDADVLVRKDINALLNYPGFAVRMETLGHNLLYQFIPDLKIYGEEHQKALARLQSKYDFSETSFNVGVMVIPTAENTPESFNEIVELANEIHGLAYFPEQAVFNLYFYQKWENIPYVYNDFFTHDWHNRFGFWRRRDDKDAVILHCTGKPKPFDKKSPYFAEWKRNYDRVDELFEMEQKTDIPQKSSIQKIELLNAINTPFGKLGRFWWKLKSKFKMNSRQS